VRVHVLCFRAYPTQTFEAIPQAPWQMGLYFASLRLVGRDDPHAAVAGRDEDEFGAAADDADLEGG